MLHQLQKHAALICEGSSEITPNLSLSRLFSLSLWHEVPKSQGEDLLKGVIPKGPPAVLSSGTKVSAWSSSLTVLLSTPFRRVPLSYVSMTLLCYLSLVFSFRVFVSDFRWMFFPIFILLSLLLFSLGTRGKKTI